jgi:hypothetical protein
MDGVFQPKGGFTSGDSSGHRLHLSMGLLQVCAGRLRTVPCVFLEGHADSTSFLRSPQRQLLYGAEISHRRKAEVQAAGRHSRMGR